MRGMIVALEGPSGVGKTTVARLLAERLSARYLEEAWEQLAPRPTLRYRSRAELLALERRLLAEESRRFRRARRLARAGVPVVADTGFLGPLTYSAGLARLPDEFDVVRPLATDALARLAAGTLGTADVTVYLDAAPPTLGERQATARATHPDDLAGRHWRVADVERGIWTAVGGARVVYAEGPPGSVATAIARGLPSRPVADPPVGAADLALRRALEIVVAALVTPGAG